MSRIALMVFALVLALLVAALAFGIGVEPVADLVGWHLLAVALATAGLLVASRHPSNPVGWLFLALAIVQGLSELFQAYGLRAEREGLPAGEVVTWVTSWIWVFNNALLALVLLLFPDGRPPSPRWRIVPVLALVGCALAVPGLALLPGDGNPFGVQGPLIAVMAATGGAFMVAALLTSAASLFLRFRRARGVERQQLKWMVFAAGCLAVAAPVGSAFWAQTVLAQLLVASAVATLPAAAAVAILRYRLYDIDVVINRTLVYGALTATLVGAYLGLVLLLQLALGPLTEDNDLAIAGSTLAVAALFRPFRARIQRLVDRRFYRRRYDAARTIEGFGARLRDEVDLDALGAELREVVADTMQPAHVSLWLRAP